MYLYLLRMYVCECIWVSKVVQFIFSMYIDFIFNLFLLSKHNINLIQFTFCIMLYLAIKCCCSISISTNMHTLTQSHALTYTNECNTDKRVNEKKKKKRKKNNSKINFLLFPELILFIFAAGSRCCWWDVVCLLQHFTTATINF